MLMVIPRWRSSGALSIWSNADAWFRVGYLSASTLVMAAVSVVLPWSTWPIVPMLTCGLLRSNFAFATAGPPQDCDDAPRDHLVSARRWWVDLDLIDVQPGPLVNRLVAGAPSLCGRERRPAVSAVGIEDTSALTSGSLAVLLRDQHCLQNDSLRSSLVPRFDAHSPFCFAMMALATFAGTSAYVLNTIE